MGCPVVQEWPASADAGRCWLVSDSDTGLKKGTGGLHKVDLQMSRRDFRSKLFCLQTMLGIIDDVWHRASARFRTEASGALIITCQIVGCERTNTMVDI